MREAGDVCYADVYKDGTGVVEFLRYEDMKYAVKKLDDSKFRSHEVNISSPVFFCSSAFICLFTPEVTMNMSLSTLPLRKLMTSSYKF